MWKGCLFWFASSCKSLSILFYGNYEKERYAFFKDKGRCAEVVEGVINWEFRIMIDE